MTPLPRSVCVCLVVLLAAALGACVGDNIVPPLDLDVSQDGEDGEDYEGFDPGGKADGLVLSDGPLVFESACAPGDRVTIAAVGDVLLHGRLQRQAFGAGTRYVSLWFATEDLMEQADIGYANLEGPTAMGVGKSGRDVPDPGMVFDDDVYSSYPQFNYHPSLIDDLMASGIDVVSTANNHSLDRRTLGADRTIDALEARGLPYTGTRRAGDASADWFTFTESNGFKLAWLACTYGTNGIPDPEKQVLLCFQHADEVESTVRELAARVDVDAVIVTPHWGNEYEANPSQAQVDLAHRLLDAGALAVIGSHPHVLQPWERHLTPDGRETFAIYSLGNFVSGQRHLPRRSTLLLYLGLTRLSDGTVGIHGARYVPLHMTTRPDGFLTVEDIARAGGPTDSRELTASMFGQFNVYRPGEALVLDPQCDPGWQPPHPHDGGIGGSCPDGSGCGAFTCLTDQPGGLCTEACDTLCPGASTFCVDLGGGTGSCVQTCGDDDECRPGYACESRSRPTDAGSVRDVCVPPA